MSTRSLSLLVACLVLGIALSLRWYLDAETQTHAATRAAPLAAPALLDLPASDHADGAVLERPRAASPSLELRAVRNDAYRSNGYGTAVFPASPERSSTPCGRSEAAREVTPEPVSEEVYGTMSQALFTPNS